MSIPESGSVYPFGHNATVFLYPAQIHYVFSTTELFGRSTWDGLYKDLTDELWHYRVPSIWLEESIRDIQGQQFNVMDIHIVAPSIAKNRWEHSARETILRHAGSAPALFILHHSQ
ncbi:uncharacterized protein EHS24_004356 [Apiotrichum porosum]|uniref:Uncharacterized protein n=1 Tax=Apiotrichum porosum TaxID=105984 RepID=A0A427Y4W5_9TREE|nr:uncharacterized protein EHS24_004356 [Apiotrichum porosum]RSH86128.1 hypothetical protein EHS24_004356 [Apiotrichum porosum]